MLRKYKKQDNDIKYDHTVPKGKMINGKLFGSSETFKSFEATDKGINLK